MKGQKIGWMLIMIFLLYGCATWQKRVVNPYKQEWGRFKETALKINLTPVIVGRPEALAYSKIWDTGSLLAAPIMRPVNKKIIRPLVFKPINYLLFQPTRPIRWAGKKIFSQGQKQEIRNTELTNWQSQKISLGFDKRLTITQKNTLLLLAAVPTPKATKITEKKVEIKQTKPKEIIHEVKKGESLWEIGQRYSLPWRKIANKNNINKPWRIFLKQKLIIPQVKRTWKKVGGNPYKGTWQKAIEGFNLPKEIKTHARRMIEQENFRWLENGLGTGQKLNQVIFSKGAIWNDVTTNWSTSQFYAGKEYVIEAHYADVTIVYHIIQVLKCGNWAWWKMEIKEKEEKKKEYKKYEEEIEEPIKPLPVLEAEKKVGIETKPIDKSDRWSHWEWDWSAGGFRERFENATRVYGVWNAFSLYPFVYKTASAKKHQFGIGMENVGWRGRTGDDFSFEGDKSLMLGPSYKLNTPKSETFFRVLFGKRDDAGFIHPKGGKYRMRQNTDILSLYGSYERWDRNEEKWFRKTRFYFTTDFDLGHRKHDEWLDDKWGVFRLKGEPDDKDSSVFGLWQDIYDYKQGAVRPQFGLETKYYNEGDKTGIRPSLGISLLNDSFFFGFNYTFWNKGNADSLGVEAWVNFYKLYQEWKKRRQE